LKHLILGFCAAGANAAEAIRRLDPEAEITVFNPESIPFYLRLDLEGVIEEKPLHHLQPRPPSFWEDKHIEVVAERAVEVMPDHKQVRAQSGQVYSYDRLLIATGASPRRLGVPGEGLPGIHNYHTFDDARNIHAARDQAKHAVIVGAGILGLELARVVQHFGWKITVLVRGRYVGSPIADPSTGEFVLSALNRKGVNVIFGDQVQEFVGDEGLRGIRTKQGRDLPAEFAAICIGVVPNVSMLERTGLLTGGQLIVNDRLQTGDPDIFAAGDVVQVRVPDGHLVLCNTWNVATSQAKIAAANMVGKDTAWDEGVLYNLDALFDQPIAIIGPWDRRHEPGFVVHETQDETSFRALVTQDGILVAALLVGDRSGDRRVRKLIANRAKVEGKLDRVFAPDARPEEFTATV
jgi:nitrite reductase (NADH) large subunit